MSETEGTEFDAIMAELARNATGVTIEQFLVGYLPSILDAMRRETFGFHDYVEDRLDYLGVDDSPVLIRDAREILIMEAACVNEAYVAAGWLANGKPTEKMPSLVKKTFAELQERLTDWMKQYGVWEQSADDEEEDEEVVEEGEEAPAPNFVISSSAEGGSP